MKKKMLKAAAWQKFPACVRWTLVFDWEKQKLQKNEKTEK